MHLTISCIHYRLIDSQLIVGKQVQSSSFLGLFADNKLNLKEYT